MSAQPSQSDAGEGGRLPFRLKRRPEERVRVLGALMDLMKPAEVFLFAEAQIKARRRAVIANHNLHSLALIQRDPELRAFYEIADLIEVDSVPLILWARLLGRSSRRFHRCTYLDWRDDFWGWVERDGLRVFFVGGEPGVAERAIEQIHRAWPGAQIGSHHGYFSAEAGSAANLAVVDAVTRFAPDVLLVGMGMPHQEVWVYRNREALPPCAIFTVGGAFDYEAGVQRPCPRWIGRLGAEWLFRLLTSPRLFSRYVIEPWSLTGVALGDLGRAARHAWRSAVDRSPIRGARRRRRPEARFQPRRTASN